MVQNSTETSTTEIRREDAVQIEVLISYPTPAMENHSNSDVRKRNQYCCMDLVIDPDKKLETALLSWINSKIPFDQDQRGNVPEMYDQSSEAPNVKITVQLAAPQRKRTSRYLCERDRREIIKRIDDGEQQVTLAKEFSVSRAAVCNLYKNRQEILARAANDPRATHPKKSHKKATSPLSTNIISQADMVGPIALSPCVPVDTIQLRRSHNDYTSGTSETEDEATASHQYRTRASSQQNPFPGVMQELTVSLPFQVHEASAHSRHCMSLVSTLRDNSISTSVFQQRVTRLARLLIEEALACLPYENEEVTNQYGDMCRVTKTLDERDICGVSMEGRGTVLLRAFSDISPASPAGIVSIDSANECPPHVKAHLPTVSTGQVVFLFDIQCATGDKACAVLHHLTQDRQIAADQIYFVTMISSLEGLQKVSRVFPGVKLVTAQMDTVLDEQQRIRPGIGDFTQRFWRTGTSEFIV
ncbi:Uracil phosphoribosyltransferase [Phytophthora infestans]|uniref:Uracil phosphoribosyltransferase n=1 Tax=Phytophthora infestans TaxID=4787 RepID=A0A8S9U2T6_PHYIN|nr:Uracil phosphoribosyltransferase [Phytophthora infestans]